MFLYTLWISVHPTYLVLSSATLSNEIFCGSSLIKNLDIICVPTTLAKRFPPSTTVTEKLQEANTMF